MFLSGVVDQTFKKLKTQTANLITLSNLSLGGFAIISILHDQLNLSLILIFIAALTDRFDGMIARKLSIESELGKQLDSMSDIVSFGVAPALLMYTAVLHQFDVPGMFFTILYIGCGAYRLARFNISENNGYFTGLPITVAGCLITMCYFAIPYVSSVLLVCMTILLSILMISPFSLKKM
ncbi:CDP-diacylglycerol--serine O-phosphatidyltransferase [Bacillus sp. BHET2]|uniref:CDP-diacylglycerol--serine O-phosphatidyltransferase n=1 Tax=Bacillus sp. BHET2 TaxID=2583818 RepID=UPI00110E67F1|nr:CDP-diacylglycerol--serine O-phosphatidyltransferase [Bacillus sp. BHET2]TMU85619.1 CDP-diacylglycerol--serine O-phosphatidyltransferase [Bacillus sp. BHET2]